MFRVSGWKVLHVLHLWDQPETFQPETLKPSNCMKNKHLVLIFLSVLAFGLVSRWLPVRYRTLFETNLLRLDAGRVDRMVIQVPGKPVLLFERVEHGWSVEQEGRAAFVQAGAVQVLLDSMSGLASFELVKTDRPDTLGLEPGKALQVRFFARKKVLETIEIGSESIVGGRSYTCIRLPGHAGVYRVPGHLRQFFGRSLHDFRDRTLLTVPPDAVRHIAIASPDADSQILERQDSSRHWASPDGTIVVSTDTVLNWLKLFARLNNSAFADYFDESRESETWCAAIVLQTAERAQTLRIFHLAPPDLPEAVTDFSDKDKRLFSAYVAHVSTNPLNYFALSDTLLVHILRNGPVLPLLHHNQARSHDFN